MDGDGEKRVRYTEPSSEVDWISDLPDCLIFHVLLNLPTKDVIKTSALSSRWKNLWRYVPGLDLTTDDIPNHNSFVSFVDRFLSFNCDSCLQSFKLTYESEVEKPQTDLVRRWLDTVAGLKVKHIDVSDISSESWEPKMSPALYTCRSLVSLKLLGLTLPSPEVVSLPSLRDMDLVIVEFTDEWGLETFISRCPALENLRIERSFGDDISILRVRSQSLLSFSHTADSHMDYDDDRTVEIDAPMLKYLKISDGRTASFNLKNPDSLVEVDIDFVFNLTSSKRLNPNDEPKRKVIHNFLVGISRVKDMTITSYTLEVIYDYSRNGQVPSFRNLSSLRVEFGGYRWEMLQVFLDSCPKLKSLVVGSADKHEELGSTIFSRRPRVLSSLQYVKIERPLKGEALEMKLVGYLLENSPILKKLTLCLDGSLKKEESAIFKELLMIRRLSKFCQVVVDPYSGHQ